jgi:hypothetical protein
MNRTEALNPTPDPPKSPPIWPNRLDGPYVVNDVIQTQLPHLSTLNVTSSNGVPDSGSYYWNEEGDGAAVAGAGTGIPYSGSYR